MDTTITTLYKNKSDRSDRNNYHGISLICITEKLFARVALHRLQQLAERIYIESQCSCRSKRSTVDMIVSQATPGEVPRVTTAHLRRIYRSNKGLRLGQ